MAERSYESAAERNAAIEQFVRWHTQRGAGSLKMYERAKEVFGGRYWQSIKGTINHVSETVSAANQYMRNINRGVTYTGAIPSRRNDPTGLRVTVNFGSSLGARKGGQPRQFLDVVLDIPFSRNKSDIKNAINQAIKEMLSQTYEGRKVNQRGAVGNWTITSMEGI